MLLALEIGAPVGVLGALIAWHQPGNRVGLLMVGGSVFVGVLLTGLGVIHYSAVRGGVPAVLEYAAYAAIWLGDVQIPWVLMLMLFPDGRFHCQFARRFAIVCIALAFALSASSFLFVSDGLLPLMVNFRAARWLAGPLAGLPHPVWLIDGLQFVGLSLPAVASVWLVDRFRNAEPLERQQIRWFLTAAFVSIAVETLYFAIPPDASVLRRVWVVLVVAALPLPTVAACIAIFRYRLWDLDRLISRTLAFALLWAGVSALFLGVALGAGLAIGGFKTNLVASLALALVLTVVLQPLRRRLDRFVVRVIYGDRPRGYELLARLGERLQSAGDRAALAPMVADAVRVGFGVPWAAVWLHVETEGAAALTPVAAAGTELGPSLVHDAGGFPSEATRLEDIPALAAELAPLWADPPAALAPLIAAEEMVGLLACAGRPGEGLGQTDLDILTLVARQSALALRNLRLEEELRLRLDDLRRSRQRLVSAQDDERRRLERDLHDGVQQQLVNLAVRLKRASASDSKLAELGAEAEESVFALQDVARGIYPSLLADQGLPAALRAHAARMPVAVVIEVAPQLVDRRFGRDVESTLYFVALEAITNAQKHAPGAHLTVALRNGRTLVLEVHDDGPGFAQTDGSGSGLQNMKDRVSALGGTFKIDSRPGAGTWVRASVPLAAEVVRLHRAGAASRR